MSPGHDTESTGGAEGALRGRGWGRCSGNEKAGAWLYVWTEASTEARFPPRLVQEKVTSATAQGSWLWTLTSFLPKVVNITTH